MKCKIKAGELLSALQMANITVDKRAGSELAYVLLSAKKGKEKNQRLIIMSTDSVSRILIRINCEVEEPGDLICEPIRLLSLLQSRNEEEIVTFANDPKSKRCIVRVGSARSALSSYGTGAQFDINSFPHAEEIYFSIEGVSLKSLLDRTSNFIYKKDGSDGMKNLLIRSVDGGYEALSTNREVVARASVTDTNSPGVVEGKPAVQVEVPGRAIGSLARILNRNKKERVKVVIVRSNGRDNSVFFRTDDVFFGLQLANAKLPAVDIVFKNQEMRTAVEVDREKFLASIHRSDPFCVQADVGRLVELEVKGAMIRLTASDVAGDFEEEIAATSLDTGEGKAKFQVGYISEVLRASGDPKVTVKIGTAGPNKKTSAMVLAGGGHASYLVGAVS